MQSIQNGTLPMLYMWIVKTVSFLDIWKQNKHVVIEHKRSGFSCI